MENKLVEVKKESAVRKVLKFFKNLFKSKNIEKETVEESNVNILTSELVEKVENEFLKEIKEKKNEENDIAVLQRLYHSGEISEEELTDEQVDKLCKFYDEKIAKLRESNERRKAKLLEYKKTKMNK